MPLPCKPSIEKFSRSHDIEDFDCGIQDLNNYFKSYALQNQAANSATTYVACTEKNIVIGYYTLAVGSVLHTSSPKRITRGLAKHPIPVMLLARLAVDANWQKNGVGRGLLKDALLRTAQAADIAGIRALLVHAKDDNVKSWYEQFDFEPSPTDPLHLFLLLKDIKKAIG